MDTFVAHRFYFAGAMIAELKRTNLSQSIEPLSKQTCQQILL